MNIEEEINRRFKLQEEFLGSDKPINKITPLVSVTVMTYQHAPYIRECLEGILMQKTDFPYEIIIGEDGSADGTREICIEYAEKHPEKIRLFLRDREQSHLKVGAIHIMLNGTFNRMSTRGTYRALCEGDDYWTDPNKLQRQIKFLTTNPEYSLSTENSLVINSVSNSKYKFSELRSGDIEIKDLILSRKFHTASVVFENKLLILPDNIREYPITDTLVFITLARNGKVHFNSTVSSVYNRNPTGLTEIDKSNWVYKIEKTSKLLDEYTNFEYSDLFNKSIAEHYFSSFLFHKRNSSFYKAWVSLIRAFQYNALTTLVLFIENLIQSTKGLIIRPLIILRNILYRRNS